MRRVNPEVQLRTASLESFRETTENSMEWQAQEG
jgi:hypothetical protein